MRSKSWCKTADLSYDTVATLQNDIENFFERIIEGELTAAVIMVHNPVQMHKHAVEAGFVFKKENRMEALLELTLIIEMYHWRVPNPSQIIFKDYHFEVITSDFNSQIQKEGGGTTGVYDWTIECYSYDLLYIKDTSDLIEALYKHKINDFKRIIELQKIQKELRR